MIPGISPTGTYTTLGTLIFVLTVNAIKDALEDAKRHKQDRIVNNRVVQIVKEGHLVDVYWKDLSVGDIVRLENNAFIPADILVLSTSDEKNSRCYIETRFFSLLSSLFSLLSLFFSALFFPAFVAFFSLSFFVFESNMDGESDYKPRKGLPDTAMYRDPASLSRLKGILRAEGPTKNIQHFSATLTYPPPPPPFLIFFFLLLFFLFSSNFFFLMGNE